MEGLRRLSPNWVCRTFRLIAVAYGIVTFEGDRSAYTAIKKFRERSALVLKHMRIAFVHLVSPIPAADLLTLDHDVRMERKNEEFPE